MTGSWRCSMIWGERIPLPRSIHRGSPACMPATTTRGEPVRRGNVSWKHQSLLILPNRLSSVWISPNTQSTISRIPKNSWNNPTEQDNLTSTLWTKDTTLKRSIALIWDTLHSCSLIPIRERKRKRISGYYRWNNGEIFDPNQYHQRNKVENRILCSEKKVRGIPQGKKIPIQVKEIKLKVILYNLSRLMKSFGVLIILEKFYRANSNLSFSIWIVHDYLKILTWEKILMNLVSGEEFHCDAGTIYLIC